MKGIVLNRINIIMIDTAEFSNPLFWVDVGISCIIIALVMFVTCFFLRRKLPIIIVSCGCALILISKFLGLNLVSYISIAFTAASLLLFFNVNIASIRTFITNPVSTKSSKFHKSNVEKVYNSKNAEIQRYSLNSIDSSLSRIRNSLNDLNENYNKLYKKFKENSTQASSLLDNFKSLAIDVDKCYKESNKMTSLIAENKTEELRARELINRFIVVLNERAVR